VTDILVLCTANTCRSPMAEALLARRLAGRGVAAVVHSAGTRTSGIQGEGQRPPPEAIAAMAACGLDTAAHGSHQLTAADLGRADMVIAMARLHVRHAVVMRPEVWPHVFTLKELVRRGEAIGSRPAGEPLAGWLDRLRGARGRRALLGQCPDDDVSDPIGGPPQAYHDTAALLDTLMSRLVEVCWSEEASRGEPPH
jgi:protein-tyrosine phosphatase